MVLNKGNPEDTASIDTDHQSVISVCMALKFDRKIRQQYRPYHGFRRHFDE